MKLEILFSKDQQKIRQSKRVVMCGLSGSGKTELAVRFTEKHREEYFAVFWINAIDETRLRDDFEGIARILDLEGDPKYSSSNVIRWLTTNSNWLLIIDNLNDESTMDLLQSEYINVGMKGDILITSNNHRAAARWSLLEVSDMELRESKVLVKNIAGPDVSEESEISELLDDLGRLPIAVDQAASYILATGISVARYRKLFKTKKSKLLQHHSSTQYNRDRRNGVLTTWEISFQKVVESHPEASRFFLMLSLLYHDDIPMQILESAMNDRRYWAPNGEFQERPKTESWMIEDLASILKDEFLLLEAIATLTKFSFLRRKSDSKSFWMHPLVHFWASQHLEADPQRPLMVICIVDLISGCFEKQDLLPPLFVATYKRRGVEERGLSLWPWRQYPTLAPHALLCLQLINNLDSIPEPIADSCLSLLQVLEYSSFGSLSQDREASRRLIDKLRSLQSTKSADRYLEICLLAWELYLGDSCGCRKNVNAHFWECENLLECSHVTEILCSSCSSAFDNADLMLTNDDVTERALALIRALNFKRAFDTAWRMRKRDSFKGDFYYQTQVHSSRSMLKIWGGEKPGDIILQKRELTSARMGFFSPEGLLASGNIGYFPPKGGLPPGEVRYFSPEGESILLKREFVLPAEPKVCRRLDRSEPSTIESYLEACTVYVTIRSDIEGGINLEGDLRVLAEAERVTTIFKTICGPDSEEYRRSSFYKTVLLDHQWQSIEQILAPLVEATIRNPAYSWSHERCIVRYIEALIGQGKKEKATEVLRSIKNLCQQTGRLFKSVEHSILIQSSPKLVEDEFQIFIIGLRREIVTVRVSPSSTVRRILPSIEDRLGLPKSVIRLIYGGKQLEEDRFISDYNIQKESTIHAVSRLSGGA
ncbi:hypothetical protein TWF694_011920 [Orbilia ellipsospora]